MILDEIRKRMIGEFQPFLLRTSDGREFKVPHREFILVGKYSVAVMDDDGDINDIAALHIASVKGASRAAGEDASFES
jgi:hypothetical protein